MILQVHFLVVPTEVNSVWLHAYACIIMHHSELSWRWHCRGEEVHILSRLYSDVKVLKSMQSFRGRMVLAAFVWYQIQFKLLEVKTLFLPATTKSDLQARLDFQVFVAQRMLCNLCIPRLPGFVKARVAEIDDRVQASVILKRDESPVWSIMKVSWYQDVLAATVELPSVVAQGAGRFEKTYPRKPPRKVLWRLLGPARARATQNKLFLHSRLPWLPRLTRSCCDRLWHVATVKFGRNFMLSSLWRWANDWPDARTIAAIHRSGKGTERQYTTVN